MYSEGVREAKRGEEEQLARAISLRWCVRSWRRLPKLASEAGRLS